MHLWLFFTRGFFFLVFSVAVQFAATEACYCYPLLLFAIPFIYLFIYGLFAFSRAAPSAYGGSQARSLIRAVATGLCQSHSNSGSNHVCDLHHSSRQRQILNPLSKARDQTRNLMVPSLLVGFVNHWATIGTPCWCFYYSWFTMFCQFLLYSKVTQL